MTLYNPYGLSMNGSEPPLSPKMKMSADGKIFLGGKFKGGLTFGTKILQTSPTHIDFPLPTAYIAILDTSSGWQNAFITHFDYHVNSNDAKSYVRQHFAVDNNNNVYVSGSYRSDHPLGYDYIKLSDGTILGGNSESFIAKYDTDGNILWYNHNSYAEPQSMTYLSSSQEIVTYGSFYNDFYSQKSQSGSTSGIHSAGGTSDGFISSSSTSGNLNWMERIGGSGKDYGVLMAKNSCNDICLLGGMEKKGGLKSDTLYYPSDKLFLARFSPLGNCVTVCNSINIALKANVYSSDEYRTKRSPIPLYIKFNKDVSGFDAGDLIINNATLSGFTGSGSTYSGYLTPVANSTVTVQVPAGVASDGVNNNLPSNIFIIVYDIASPDITINGGAGNYFNTSTYTISVVANEAVFGLTASDLQLTNCTLKSFTDNGNNKSYTVVIAPVTEGNISVFIPSGMAADSVGNLNNASNIFTRTYDITPPAYVITTTATNPTATSPIPITITFSEPMLSLDRIDGLSGSYGYINGIDNPSGDKKTFTALIYCTASANFSVFIYSEYAKDLAGNGVIGSGLLLKYDITRPTAFIYSPTNALTSLSPIPVTVNFSKKIYGLSAADFIVTNGTVSNITGSGTSYTADVTPAANGDVSIQLSAEVVQDTLGNFNDLSNTLTRTFDGIKPQVTVTSNVNNPTKTTPIPVTFTFTKNVTGFASADVTITNGTISGFYGSGKDYSAYITPMFQGTVTVKVNDGVAQDVALNMNTASNIFFTVFDNINPEATITTTATSPTRDALIPLTITFTENVTGFTQSDITANNATISNFAGSGSVYTFDVTPTAIGSFDIQIFSVFDEAGNISFGGYYNNLYQGNDYTGPDVTISTVHNPTPQPTIPITITFTEPVTGLGLTDFIVTNGIIGYLSGSGMNYTVSLYPSSEGLVTLRINANAAVDIALNNNIESNLLSINYVPETIRPTVTITSSITGSTTNPVIPITITFSEDIYELVDWDDFSVSNGFITNVTGSGSTYTATLTATSTGPALVTIPAYHVRDLGGNPNLESNLFTVDYVDIIQPTATIISRPVYPNDGITIYMTISFSEDITGFSLNDLTVSNGSITNFTNLYASGKDYVATLIPAAPGTVSVLLPANVVTDLSGNGNVASNLFTVDYVDNIKPTATITSSITSPAHNPVIPITITFSEVINGFSLNDITVTNGSIANLSGSGTMYTADLLPLYSGSNVYVYLLNNVVTDISGNGNIESNTFGINYIDNIQPTATITSSISSPTNNPVIPITIIFSEPINGFYLNYLTVTNGSITNLSGSGTNYTASLLPAAFGTVSIIFPANTVHDMAGNGNVGNSFSINYVDNIQPTATITSIISSPTNNPVIPITIIFSEAISDFYLNDFTVTNGSITNLSGSGTTYTASLLATTSGTVAVLLKANGVTDVAGNGNTAASFNISYSGVNGLHSSALFNEMKVYPNPTSNMINLDYSGTLEGAELIVTNILGEPVYKKILYMNNFSIDLSFLSDGAYNLSVCYRGMRFNRGIIVQH